eukprot:1161329-Pelagomonas_calceolata.AAC.2
MLVLWKEDSLEVGLIVVESRPYVFRHPLVLAPESHVSLAKTPAVPNQALLAFTPLVQAALVQPCATVHFSADLARLEDCRQELHAILQEERLFGATLLVLANKQDLPSALKLDELGQWMEAMKQIKAILLPLLTKQTCAPIEFHHQTALSHRGLQCCEWRGRVEGL